MKRILAVFIVLVVLVLAACGGETEATPTGTAPAVAQVQATATIELQDTATPIPQPTTTASQATATAQPTNTTVPPTGSPTVAASPTTATVAHEFASGGLGLSRETWEQEHTQSDEFAGMVDYDGGKYTVIFTDGNIAHLEQSFGDNQPTLSDARTMGATLIPGDSQLIETYQAEHMPELTVDLYMSESLKGRFGSDVWVGGEPGNFIVIYGVFDNKVPRIVIGTGNNP